LFGEARGAARELALGALVKVNFYLKFESTSCEKLNITFFVALAIHGGR
jgi:hypothetical protein